MVTIPSQLVVGWSAVSCIMVTIITVMLVSRPGEDKSCRPAGDARVGSCSPQWILSSTADWDDFDVKSLYWYEVDFLAQAAIFFGGYLPVGDWRLIDCDENVFMRLW